MTRTVSLSIEGMTCGHCQKAVTQALQQVEGVERVEVNLEKGEAAVEVRAPLKKSGCDSEQLVAAVQEEGYQAAVV